MPDENRHPPRQPGAAPGTAAPKGAAPRGTGTGHPSPTTPRGTHAGLRPPAAAGPRGTNTGLKPPAAGAPGSPLLQSAPGSRAPGGTNALLKPVSGHTQGGVPNPLLEPDGAEDAAFQFEESEDKFSRMHPLPPEVEVPLKGGAPALVRSSNLGWNESAPPDGRAPGLHRPGPPTPAMERLLSGAAKLFNERGFERTSLEGLAEATGFPRQRLITAFKTKEAIFVRVLQIQTEELTTALRKSLPADKPVPVLIKGLAELTSEALKTRPLLSQMLLCQLDAQLPGWEDHLVKLRRRMQELFSQLLRIGVKEGHIRPELPVEVLGGVVFELLVVTSLLDTHSTTERQTQRRTLALDALFNGIRTR